MHFACTPNMAGISDIAFKALASACGSKLQSLVLIRNIHLTDASVIELVENCPNITHIDLGYCSQLSNDALLKIASSGNLIKLDLYNTNVSGETALALVQNHPHLKYLSLSRCSRVSDQLIEIFNYLPRLEFLYLSETRLTKEILYGLAHASMPFLTFVDLSNSPTAINPEDMDYLRTTKTSVYINTQRGLSKVYQT